MRKNNYMDEIKTFISNGNPSETLNPDYSELDIFNTKEIIGLKNSNWRNEFFKYLYSSSIIKI